MTAAYTYRLARDDDQARLFRLYRSVMKSHIELIWGWDEQWQEHDFSEHFEPNWITVVLSRNEPVGYAQVEPRSNVLYLRMFLLDPEHQNKGVGTGVLKRIISAASEEHLGVMLQVFKINKPARRFYEHRGFRVVGETSTSLVMELDASRASRS
jgi:GNAT superfamily N-acetyltransferase